MRKISEIHTYSVEHSGDVYTLIVDVDETGYTLDVRDAKGETADSILTMFIIDMYEDYKEGGGTV
jgi:hypothetical protein